jgi:hypothetical protein
MLNGNKELIVEYIIALEILEFVSRTGSGDVILLK